jgi:hypothetical protein
VRLSSLLVFALLVARPLHAEEAPPPPVVQVGWGGLSVNTPDGDFGVALQALVQAEAELSAPTGAPAQLGAGVTRVRSVLRAHGFGDRVSGQLQIEFIGTPRVLDARVDLRPAPPLLVSLGQQIVPLTRAWDTPLGNLAFRARSPLNTTLAPGRRFGARFALASSDGRASVGAGVFAPDVLPGLQPAAPPMGYVRVVGAPFGAPAPTELPGLRGPAPGRLALGVGALLGPGDKQPDEALALVADLTAQLGPMSALAEGGFKTQLHDPIALRWSASLGVSAVVLRSHLTVGGRMLAEGSKGAPAPTLLEPELVVGGYAVGEKLRLLASYGYRIEGEGRGHHALLQAQFAL